MSRFRTNHAIGILPAMVLGLTIAAPVSAQEAGPVTASTPILFATVELPAMDSGPSLSGVRTVQASQAVQPPVTISMRQSRPLVLPPLYAATVGLQLLDAHSTFKALDAGAYEANPLMRNVAYHPGAMLAVKATVAAATIFAAERMWKKNRVGAVVAMLAVNSAYAAVVMHNYRNAQRMSQMGR